MTNLLILCCGREALKQASDAMVLARTLGCEFREDVILGRPVLRFTLPVSGGATFHGTIAEYDGEQDAAYAVQIIATVLPAGIIGVDAREVDNILECGFGYVDAVVAPDVLQRGSAWDQDNGATVCLEPTHRLVRAFENVAPVIVDRIENLFSATRSPFSTNRKDLAFHKYRHEHRFDSEFAWASAATNWGVPWLIVQFRYSGETLGLNMKMGILAVIIAAVEPSRGLYPHFVSGVPQLSSPTEQVRPSPVNMQVLLSEKLANDFHASFLDSTESLSQASRKALYNLHQANLLPRTGEPRIDTFPSNLPPGLWSGELLPNTIKTLRDIGTIHIRCAAIYPAIVATVASLKEKFCPSIEIHVEVANSIELVTLINREQYDDIIFAAEDPFFLVGRQGSFAYRRVIPVLRAPQWVFGRRGAEEQRRVYVVSGSSAAAQILSGFGSSSRPELQFIDAAEIVSRAISLNEGEQMPVWDPIASKLLSEPTLEVVRDSRYDIHVSMFARRERWYGSSPKERALRTFVHAFIAEWNVCRFEVDRCIALLRLEPEFSVAFARGSGVDASSFLL